MSGTLMVRKHEFGALKGALRKHEFGAPAGTLDPRLSRPHRVSLALARTSQGVASQPSQGIASQPSQGIACQASQAVDSECQDVGLKAGQRRGATETTHPAGQTGLTQTWGAAGGSGRPMKNAEADRSRG